MKPSFQPRPYQKIMVEHAMHNKRCALWAEVGLGKTGGVLITLDNLALSENIYPVLIPAPLRVARSTWSKEVEKWSTFRHIGVSPIVGTSAERALALKQPADIYTINFENIPWLIEHLGDRWPFKTFVVDESSKLSGFRLRQGTKRSQALASKAFLTERFIELTGTPSLRGLTALWGQLYFLDKGVRLGRSFYAFQQRWFKTGWDGFSLQPLPGAQEEIHERIKDICLSVQAADYFDLQKPIVTNITVDLDDDARELYRDMEKKMYIEIEGEGIEAFNAATKSGKLLQLANGAVYLDPTTEDDKTVKEWRVVHDKKIEALEDIIEESNGVIIVAFNFRSDLARLKKAFPKGRHIQTLKDEEDFKAGKIELAFMHPASIGHGVDGFQYVTNKIVFFGLTWSPEDYDQIIGRIGPVRQMQAGFNRNVFVYHIVAGGTVDEDVLVRLETKRNTQDVLLEGMKRRINGYN